MNCFNLENHCQQLLGLLDSAGYPFKHLDGIDFDDEGYIIFDEENYQDDAAGCVDYLLGVLDGHLATIQGEILPESTHDECSDISQKQ